MKLLDWIRSQLVQIFPIPFRNIVAGMRDGILVLNLKNQVVHLNPSAEAILEKNNQATIGLETMFAPRGSEMGSMVDILGVGVIIRGESGIGKSECVLELIERGYSLVADDITKVTLLEGREIIGTSPAITHGLRPVGMVS